MAIAPEAPQSTHFEGLVVVRSGGFAGMTERVHVDPKFTTRLESSFPGAGPKQFELDAAEAEQLVHALGRLVDSRPAADSRRIVYDGYQYDIELHWGGTVYRVHAAELAADEALHGVVMIASRLMTGRPSISLRGEPSTRDAAPSTTLGLRPGTWHPGLVDSVQDATTSLSRARDALTRYIEHTGDWSRVYDIVHPTTNLAALRVTDAVRMFDDLPDNLLKPMVEAVNTTNRLLDELQTYADGVAPDGAVLRRMVEDYVDAIARLRTLPEGVRPIG
jgi:hypothetical protein